MRATWEKQETAMHFSTQLCVISWAQHHLGPLLPDRLHSAAHLSHSLLSVLLNLLHPTLPPCLGARYSCVFVIERREYLRCTKKQNIPGEIERGLLQPAPLVNQTRPPSMDSHTEFLPQCMHPYTSRSQRGKGVFTPHYSSSAFIDWRVSEACHTQYGFPNLSTVKTFLQLM